MGLSTLRLRIGKKNIRKNRKKQCTCTLARKPGTTATRDETNSEGGKAMDYIEGRNGRSADTGDENHQQRTEKNNGNDGGVSWDPYSNLFFMTAVQQREA